MRKLLLLLIFAIFSVFLISEKTCAFANGGKECAKCHTLSADQAKQILSNFMQEPKILNIQVSPINGLWEIGFETGNKKSIAYLDFSYQYIITGNIISTKTKANLTEESFLKISKVDLKGFPYKNALVLGDKNAKNRVIVFDDPD